MSKKQINELIAGDLLGILTPEEEATLAQWKAADAQNARLAEEFARRQDLMEHLEQYRKVNAEQAWQQFEASHPRARIVAFRSIWKYAAALLVLFTIAGIYRSLQTEKPIPPEIPAEVQLAMQMSKESGKMEAEVVDYRGERREDGGERNVSSTDNQQDYSPSTLPTPPSSDISAEDLLSARRITTYHDKEYWVTLDDGTLVHLNYNTRLIYPEKFGRKNRTVILDGEAYFMVAKDKSRPFIVHTPNGDVKVYGTEFNVNTRTENISPSTLLPPPSSKTTTVVLVNGSVSVTPTGGKEQLLKPGQQAIYNAQSSKFNVQDVDVEPYVAWNTGRFSFQEWPLDKVMEVVSRWNGYKVEYASDDIRSFVLTGYFNRYDDMQSILEALKTVTNMRFSIKSNTIIIQK